MYDYLIVGSGMFGAVFAQQALRACKSVIVIDRRTHIGGNCYTEKREGIDVHVYGPHIFHTSSKEVWEYVNNFTKFDSFMLRPKVRYRDRMFSFPINLMTLHQLWGVNSPQEAREKLDSVRVPCENPRNLEEWILSQVGHEVYETFIHGYTTKQWMREPKDLPASIIKRLPIRLTFDDNYFDDYYQGIPSSGYTEMFENMLYGCEVALGEDFFSNREKWERMAKNVVFTGRIDEYFGFLHGELEYRTLNFEHHTQQGDYQGNAVVNYSETSVPWTRITEHKHFLPHKLHKHSNTVWTREYPAVWQKDSVPYYPIGDVSNTSRYVEYKKLSERMENVIMGGRLAEYRYYDMHQVIGSALQKSKAVLSS